MAKSVFEALEDDGFGAVKIQHDPLRGNVSLTVVLGEHQGIGAFRTGREIEVPILAALIQHVTALEAKVEELEGQLGSGHKRKIRAGV